MKYDKLKIAYVCADHGIPIFGNKGSSIHVQEVLSTLVKFGFDLHLFTNNLGGDKFSHLDKIKIHELPILKDPSLKSIKYFNYTLKKKLHDVGLFDIIYERYSLWSFSAMEYAKSNKIPGILEINSPLIEEQIKYRYLKNQYDAKLTTNMVFNNAKILVAVSNGIASYLSNNYPSLKNKIHVVPNGVNIKFFDPKKVKGTRLDSRFTIGFIGSMKPWHGLSILVRSFQRLCYILPNIKLLIIGDGPEKESLIKDLNDRNLLKNTEIMSNVPRSEIPILLSSLDVAVAPYPFLENFYFSPLKIYEYMAMGLPVVASRIGQISELIENEINGLLTTPGNSSEIVDAILKLYYDSKLRKKLGINARETIVKTSTWDMVIERILDLSYVKENIKTGSLKV
ncbi:MAG: glycosyltransferase family 4 protein [Nitrososphaeraceae archaeon]